MKILTLLFVATLIVTMTACDNTKTNSEKTGSATTVSVAPATDASAASAFDTSKLAKGAMFYQCSMHPEVVADKPGDCPKCCMKLIMVHKS